MTNSICLISNLLFHIIDFMQTSAKVFTLPGEGAASSKTATMYIEKDIQGGNCDLLIMPFFYFLIKLNFCATVRCV